MPAFRNLPQNEPSTTEVAARDELARVSRSGLSTGSAGGNGRSHGTKVQGGARLTGGAPAIPGGKVPIKNKI